MRCPQCGFGAATRVAFCARCGTRLMLPRPEAKHEYALTRILPSWWHFTNKLVGVVILIVVGLVVIAYGESANPKQPDAAGGVLILGLVLIALGVISALSVTIVRRHLAWSLTSERLIERRGVLSTRRRELELADVRSVEVDRRFLQRMLGLGDVIVASAASADFIIRLLDIPDPERIAEILRQARTKRLA
ncbi:MAG: PH domain-containing protein [Candidatus Binataceae bacterium]